MKVTIELSLNDILHNVSMSIKNSRAQPTIYLCKVVSRMVSWTVTDILDERCKFRNQELDIESNFFRDLMVMFKPEVYGGMTEDQIEDLNQNAEFGITDFMSMDEINKFRQIGAEVIGVEYATFANHDMMERIDYNLIRVGLLKHLSTIYPDYKFTTVLEY